MFKRTDKVDRAKMQLLPVTIIEIRPFRNGWKCFEGRASRQFSQIKSKAIDYARCRARFRTGEIRVFDSRGAVERVIAFSQADRKL
jgi:hypothetical protein